MPNITNLGLTLLMSQGLQAQQTQLSLLSQQLATEQKHNDLTQYAPTDAHNILDFQNAVTQRQSYLASMQNVQTRLSLYDGSMNDIESMAGQAEQLATQNQSFDPTKATDIAQQATNFLQSLTNDLNQQIGGRFIYAGTRYTTQPVTDLTTLTTPPTTTPTTSPALPPYDTQFNTATSFSVNGTPPTGSLNVGNVSIAWSQLSNNNTGSVNVTVNGVSQAVAVPSLINGNTTADLASNASATLTALAATLPGSAGLGTLTSGATGSNVSLSFGTGNPLPVTPDAGGAANETVWQGGPLPDGTTQQTFTSPSLSINGTPTGNFTISNVSIPWSQIASGHVTSVTVGGVTTPVAVTGLSNGGAPTDLASNLSLTLNQIASQVPAGSNISTLSANATGASVAISFGAGTPQAITPDQNGRTGEIGWSQGSTPDGTVAQTPSSSPAAYTKDTVLIDSNFSITYGISSNDPAFQNMVNGLRFISSAVTAGQNGDTATYQADMEQAAKLINTGLSGIQTLHAQVASNQNILTQETTTQNTDIATLQNQLTNIQQVNLSQVGTELNLLQTQLQASYSATASIEQLSLVKYL